MIGKTIQIVDDRCTDEVLKSRELEVYKVAKENLGGLQGRSLHYVRYIEEQSNVSRIHREGLHLKRYKDLVKDNGGWAFQYCNMTDSATDNLNQNDIDHNQKKKNKFWFSLAK